MGEELMNSVLESLDKGNLRKNLQAIILGHHNAAK